MAERHFMQGYQTGVKNDLYYVEEQLQAYDPTLYIMFNPNDGTHLIMDGVLDIAVMKIPQIGFEELDSRVVEHIKRIHSANGFKASHELKQYEERKQREQERQEQDLAHNLAKDSYKPVRELAYYGRT